MSDIDYHIEAAPEEYRPRSYRPLILILALIGFALAYEVYRLEAKLTLITQVLSDQSKALASLPALDKRVQALEDAKNSGKGESYATQISILSSRISKLEPNPLDPKPLTNQSLKSRLQDIQSRLEAVEKKVAK
jgi:hypothetical protein